MFKSKAPSHHSHHDDEQQNVIPKWRNVQAWVPRHRKSTQCRRTVLTAHAVPTYFAGLEQGCCGLPALLLPPPSLPSPPASSFFLFFPGPTCLAFPLSLSLSFSFVFYFSDTCETSCCANWELEAGSLSVATCKSQQQLWVLWGHPWPPTPPLTPLPFYLLPPGPGKRKREKL